MAVLVAAPFLLVGLGGVPFDDPGEGMHAEIARELYASGDPLDLRLGGVRYLDKPRSEERRVGKECRSRWSPYH